MANRRRSEGFGFFLPILGVILIMPPIVQLFDRGGSVFGLPIIFTYIFGVWLFLIVAAFILSRWLPQQDETPQRLERFDRDQDR
ncbi:hypothetical protein [Maritalea mediterranea]|uniref:DUF3311 domain-containing protein n=1 Tax=Maritalea mediterranea TaxID=2909667 RepID=A0ABS9E899_9HYPH|nr:hypothetical protein [Maritalea mediterranea]MCF4099102.1 hypothetical protein [Maritalea mediterranea]